MEELVLEQLANAPKWVLLVYIWKDFSIGIAGPLFAAIIAIWQVRQLVLSTRTQYFETIKQEQTGILNALSAELSAFIYFQIDVITELDSGQTLRIRNIPERVIFTSNSGRVGSMTGRAFGMLTIYYTRLDNIIKAAIEADTSDTAEIRTSITRSIGHAALIRSGLRKISSGHADIRLSDIPDDYFRATISGFTSSEQQLIQKGRDAWIDFIGTADRT